ncbi:hypothetical protein GCM10009504_39860 [Pseudomonas laurentiana]|uniref:Uncharacterized protein n=1 Tax=Pseudomonas laurentiana TaxID=2364649 RepID=A0A6I5RMG6_9PSED|nr:hypothetical protein [Pseudomonas laurentiana]NES09302.1 hypothetical protein [Pseudomonas laurentiana]GGU79023.1 hypothetical protein GCM10009504_39860 [Pseudomonas laurentiana]
MAVPDEPENDPVTAYLLSTFRNITRGRRFLTTMAGAFPLPLSAREISDWLEAYPPAMARAEIDEVVFTLDALCLAEDED